MQAIKQNLFLTHLSFENNPLIGNGELNELKHFFNNNECLKNLNLSGCGIEAWHVKEAIEGLYAKHSITSRSGNNSLHTLNLSDNKLMGEGAMYFTEILENDKNTGLKCLDLSRNSVSDEAGVVLAKALETNTILAKLSLKNNFLSDDSGKAFSECLKRNKTLTKVNLDKNSIKVKYILEIKEHLLENQTIAIQK